MLLLQWLSPTRSGGAPSARQDGALLYPGPLCGGEVGTTGPQGVGRDVDSFSPGQDALSKSPAPPHELAGHGDGMDAGGRTTQEQLSNARQAPSGVSFSLGYFSFTAGILPSALRASFAVHTRSCAYVDKQKRSTSGREADRNALDSSNTRRPERRASRTGCARTGGVNEVPTWRRGCQERRSKPQGQNALFAWQMLADGCRSTPLASLASATGEGGQVLWRRWTGGCRLAEFPSIPLERMAQRR